MNETKIYNNKSPLRYPGGKTRACRVLDEILKSYFNIENVTTLVSPFFGGGSFEFYLQNKYNWSICANDKFKPLYAFWNTCKEDKKSLCNNLYQLCGKVNKEHFTEYRNTIINENNEQIQATKFFVINRCSFSGATLSGGFSQQSSLNRFTTSSVDRIRKLNLSNIRFSNEDFTTFLINITDNLNRNTGDIVVFLDPPYYLEKKSRLYGNNGNMHDEFEHITLYNSIRSLPKNIKWMMTYNDCPFIRELYKDYTIINAEWSYGMNKTKTSSEIVIISHKLTYTSGSSSPS